MTTAQPSLAEHTERTPLLGPVPHNGRPSAPEITEAASAPPILPYVAQLHAQGLPSEDDWCPDSLSPEEDRTAFLLLVWLHYMETSKKRTLSVDDIWEQWSTETKDASATVAIEHRIKEIWDTFLGVPRAPAEVEHVLWKYFPLTRDELSPTIRVIDFYAYLPREILSHRMLESSLVRTWKRNLLPSLQPTSVWDAVKRRLRAAYTPRVIHASDLSGLAAYLGILILYSLRPPRAAIEEATAMESIRAVLIVSYCTARVLRDFSLSRLPFLLTAVAFLSEVPAPPSSNFGYSAILIALCIHVIQLHMPSSPSPLYLFPFHQALPLATLLWNGFAKIYLPVLLLFLPALLVASLLLSFSLADITITSTPTILAPPLEARTMFVLLLVTILLLLICSLGMLVLVYPFISSNSSGSPWDRYSTRIGLDARREFVRSVLTYTLPYSHTRLYLSPAPHSSFYMRIQTVVTTIQRILWWIAAGPLAILLICFWCWEISA